MYSPYRNGCDSKSWKLLLVLALLAVVAMPVVRHAQSVLRSITVSAAPKNSDATKLVSSLTVRFQPGVHAYRGEPLPGADLIHGVNITLGHSYRDNIETLSFSEPLFFNEAVRVGNILKKAGVVEFADVMLPLHELTADPLIETTCTDTGAGTDGCRAKQDWWMNEIGAYTAWTDGAANTSGVTVAVLDTGSRNHPDMTTPTSQWVPGYDMIGLSSALWYGTLTDLEGGQYTSAGDGDGRDPNPTDMGTGRDANTCHSAGPIILNQPSIYPLVGARDSSWHGLEVAGIISAQKGNGIGLSGIAPNVKIQPVRVLGKCLESDDANNLPDGIDWASGEQVGSLPLNTTSVKVINMSLGTLYPPDYPCPTVYQNAIYRALVKGIVVVAAAGNDHDDAKRNYPSGCAGVISVGASTFEHTLSTYSNSGADLSAPGGELGSDNTKKILMLSNSGAIDASTDVYKYGQGTSMSSPMVAAAAAMARTKYPLSSNPNQTPAAIKSAFMYAASLGTQCEGCGSGILNIPTFLGVLSPTATPSVPLNTSVTQGRGAVLHVTWSAPATAAWNPITSYMVSVRNISGSMVDSCVIMGVETLECDLTNLTQDVQYTVSVTASRGSASSTTPVATITSRRQARAPSGLAVTKTNSSATFSWTEPTDVGGDTLGQIAELIVYSSQTGDSVVQRCYANFSTCDVTDLEPGTTYWADVKRWGNSFEFTQTSARVQFTTTGTYVAPTTTTIPPVVATTIPPVVATTIPPVVTTTTISSTKNSSGSSSPSAVTSIYSVKAGATAVKPKLLTLAKLEAPKGSEYALSVVASSKKFCKVLGTAIKTLQKGICEVNVTVRLKGKKPTTKTVKITVN